MLQVGRVKNVLVRDRGSIRNRARRRASASGFSLIELMVVIVLVALLAAMAIPALKGARDDRACFNFARQYSQLIHHGRTASSQSGTASLVVIDAAAGIRGTARIFQAQNTGVFPAPFRVQNPPEALPVPQPSCMVPTQWAAVPGFAIGTPGAPASPFLDGVNMTTTNAGDAFYNVASQIFLNGAVTPAAVICYTPAGTAYVGIGADVTAAIAAMYGSQPFSGILEVEIRRRNAADLGIGIRRRVVVAGGAQPRIQSQ